jgi:hypothetical protein
VSKIENVNEDQGSAADTCRESSVVREHELERLAGGGWVAVGVKWPGCHCRSSTQFPIELTDFGREQGLRDVPRGPTLATRINATGYSRTNCFGGSATYRSIVPVTRTIMAHAKPASEIR